LGINVRVSDGELNDESLYYVEVAELTGIEDIVSVADAVTTYPNPAKDYIMFEINSVGEFTLELIDITGKIWFKNNYMIEDAPIEVGISDMPGGLYFYKVYNNTEQFRGNLVIKK
jgi:hypothetical protein